MKRTKLSLKREALTELTSTELGALAGGALSDVCVTATYVVCITVGDCITDDCVTAITYITRGIGG